MTIYNTLVSVVGVRGLRLGERVGRIRVGAWRGGRPLMNMTREQRIARANEIFDHLRENAAYLKHAQEVVRDSNEAHRRIRWRKTA